MTRDEFMKKLEDGLAGVLPEERDNAIQYYTEYLDDAGTEHEAESLAELGDPIKLAADIRAASEPEKVTVHSVKAEPGESSDEIPRWDSAAEQSQQESRRKEFPGGYTPPNYKSEEDGHIYTAEDYSQESDNYFYSGNSTRRSLFIVLLVLLSPVILGLGVAGIVLLLVPFIVAIALGLSTAVIIILGILLIGASVANGLLILGIALLLLAATLMLVYGGIRLYKTVVPTVIHAYYSVYYKFIGTRGGYAQ